MTEDEAKSKWCPFARDSNAGGNRLRYGAGGDGVDPQYGAEAAGEFPCIASRCMAFRWLPDVLIPLAEGRVARLSAEDRELEAGGYWWGGRYAKNDLGYLHRHVAENMWGPLPRGMFVDHIDGDPLNCRRGNLRLVTPQQNAANAAPRGGKSRHRGVFAGQNGRWAAQISRAGVRLHLGTFDTEDEAARAYDAAAANIHGEFARLNLTSRRDSGRVGYCGLAGALS